MSHISFPENLQQSLSSSQRPNSQFNKRRIQYGGGFKMREPLIKSGISAASTELDKDLIYSKLGYNFSEENSPMVQSRSESQQFVVTTSKRQFHNCKFAPKYQCNVHDGTLKMTKSIIEPPLIERTKQDYQVEGDVICYYYEPNHGQGTNSIVVINSSKVHRGGEIYEEAADRIVENIQKPSAMVSPKLIDREKPPASKQLEKKQSSQSGKIVQPSPSQVLQYKHKYKQYIANKRDHHFAILLKKLIEKIDFERFQCTSPNEQRIKAQWKGKFRPRVLVTMAGLVCYYQQSSEGINELKKFLYLFLCRGGYDIKQPYQVVANLFIDEFSKFLHQKKDYLKNPDKALNKLNFRKTHQLLKETISTSYVKQFFEKMKFIQIVLNSHLQIPSSEKKSKLNYHEFQQLFTVVPEKPAAIKESPQKPSPSKSPTPQKPTQHHLLFKTDEQIDKMKIKAVPEGILSSDHQPKRTTIRQYKLQEDLAHMKLEEDDLLHYRFKAHDIPKAVADKDRYKQLLLREEEKRNKIKAQSQQKTKENQKPFSFYKRPEEKKKTLDQYYNWNRTFTARSVPNIVKKNIYNDMIREKEQQRDLKMKARQYQLMSASHYPQSMRNLKNYKSARQQRIQDDRRRLYGTLNTNLSFYRQIPNFVDLHRQNNLSLQRIKLNNRTTQPKEFNFSIIKHPLRNTIQLSPPKPSLSRVFSASNLKHKVPQTTQYVSPSTLKFDAYVNKRRQVEKERQRKKTGSEVKRDHQYEQHKRDIIKRLAENIPTTPQSKPKEVMKGKWTDKKQAIIKKVYEEGPLLIERQYFREDGKKVQKIVVPPQPSDKFDTIL